jgi:hypothetical protein
LFFVDQKFWKSYSFDDIARNATKRQCVSLIFLCV